MYHQKEVARRCENAFSLAAEGVCVANDFGSCQRDKNRSLAIEALWRSLESGLIIFDGAMSEYDENGLDRPFNLMDLIRLREDPWGGIAQWMSAEYVLSPSGKALVKDTEAEYIPGKLPSGFFERLSEIFTAHGVGWDVPCPYEIVPWNRPGLRA